MLHQLGEDASGDGRGSRRGTPRPCAASSSTRPRARTATTAIGEQPHATPHHRDPAEAHAHLELGHDAQRHGAHQLALERWATTTIGQALTSSTPRAGRAAHHEGAEAHPCSRPTTTSSSEAAPTRAGAARRGARARPPPHPRRGPALAPGHARAPRGRRPPPRPPPGRPGSRRCPGRCSTARGRRQHHEAAQALPRARGARGAWRGRGPPPPRARPATPTTASTTSSGSTCTPRGRPPPPPRATARDHRRPAAHRGRVHSLEAGFTRGVRRVMGLFASNTPGS